ncbi:TonB-dependent receptor [Steroidobacter agaridevorans]|nr:TonB-dependent receptor [Steroidobacter agaridevorans]
MMRMNGLSRAALSAAFLQTCVFAAPASAADTPRDAQVLQEIIVTATKREEKLQDVPVAISAITTEDIQTRGFTNYADYLNTVPGVFFEDGGPGVSQIRIRGISGSEGGLPSTTATYFGETVTSVLTNFGGKPNLRLVDIDRVEVLRGPQGTLFGASALAGVVRILPAAPDASGFEAHVGARGFTTAHSSDASYHVEGTVNIPLITDRLALRVVGYQDEIAGYIDNKFAGQPSVDYGAALGLPDGLLVTPAVPAFTRKDINSEDTWGVRAALGWQVTDALKIDLTHATQDVTLNSEPFTMPEFGEYEQSRALDYFEEGGAGERLEINTIVAKYDWDAVSLTSASNWSKMTRFTNQDITYLAEGSFGAPIPWPLRDRSVGKLFTQELRLQSLGDGPFQWLAGLFYLKQTADFSQFVPDYSCPTCLPEVLAGQDFAADAPMARFSEEEQRAAFAQVSYTFASQWTVGVGARYLEDDLTSLTPASDGFLIGGAQPGAPDQEGSSSEFNPSAYLRYEPAEDLTLYLQAGRGFRSGVVNQRLPDACQAAAAAVGAGAFTDPDTLWNYELGVKSQFADGRLGLNAAVYRQDWEGVQLGVALPCGFSVLANAGDVTNDGVELEMVAQAGDAWRFNFAASYTQAEFERVEPGTIYSKGERLPDAPEKNGSVGAQYSFVMGPEWSGYVRADYVYVGELRLKFGVDEVLSQESFNTANLRIAFQREDLSIELFGRNLADERGVIDTGQPSLGAKETLIRPREVGVELRYGFQ